MVESVARFTLSHFTSYILTIINIMMINVHDITLLRRYERMKVPSFFRTNEGTKVRRYEGNI